MPSMNLRHNLNDLDLMSDTDIAARNSLGATDCHVAVRPSQQAVSENLIVQLPEPGEVAKLAG